MLEVVGPAPQDRREPVKQDCQRKGQSLPGDRPYFPGDRVNCFLGRVGVEVSCRASSLLVPLDAEPQKVEAPRRWW